LSFSIAFFHTSTFPLPLKYSVRFLCLALHGPCKQEDDASPTCPSLRVSRRSSFFLGMPLLAPFFPWKKTSFFPPTSIHFCILFWGRRPFLRCLAGTTEHEGVLDSLPPAPQLMAMLFFPFFFFPAPFLYSGPVTHTLSLFFSHEPAWFFDPAAAAFPLLPLFLAEPFCGKRAPLLRLKW